MPAPARAGRAALPLRVEVPALPARGGADLVRGLFEPLGWTVTAEPVRARRAVPGVGRLAVRAPGTGGRSCARRGPAPPVRAAAGARRRQALLGLARRGRQAAAGRRGLARRAPGAEADHQPLPVPALGADPGGDGAAGAGPARRVRRHRGRGDRQRRRRGDRHRGEAGAARRAAPGGDPRGAAACRRDPRARPRLRPGPVGAGAAEGPGFTEIVGVDVSIRALTIASRRLKLDRMGERQAARVRLLQGSLAYTDKRLKGYDAAVLSEVIEHLDLPRLPALEYAVFGSARPRTVLVTTPNVEYNVRWETLPAGHARHGDHRFEWTREEFRDWAAQWPTPRLRGGVRPRRPRTTPRSDRPPRWP